MVFKGDVHRVAGDHQLLVRADEGGLHLGVLGGDDGVLAEGDVRLVVHLEAQVGEVLQDAAAEAGVVLADAAGEDDQVHAVHRGHVGADVLDDVVGELLEGELGLGIAVVRALVQFAAVGAVLGNAQKTGLAVEDARRG